MQASTRKEALSLGLTHYFTGLPCGRGHYAKRFTSNCQCSACLRKWEHDNPEKVRQKERNWIDANRAKDRAKVVKRNAHKVQATPAWADLDAIQAIYGKAECMGPEFQVDHIMPLISPLVCGLHCEANLQILTKFENQSKGNRYWPDMF